MPSIFIDGQEGTTGLQIHQRLADRSDLELLLIDPEKRKDPQARRELLNAADVAILCLPDAAAKESVLLVNNDKTRIIDASTAHRTAPNWAYGFPELSSEHRSRLAQSTRIANPGCHATGFAAVVYPLVRLGIMPKDYPVSCQSITGYSGGGKKLINYYQSPDAKRDKLICPRHYALTLNHKHLPEMQVVSGLDYPPLFTPILGDFYQGMAVAIPLHTRLLTRKMTGSEIHQALTEYYADQHFVRVLPFESELLTFDGGFDPTACNGTNFLDLCVFGHKDQTLVMARLDNLGKGASGAAVQSLNIVLCFDERTGL
jgi:N-acetyl-gamma-glutamyl-phosphate reductase